jgi:glycoprotein-N-acetylgalactosamine 3-beta-galactosyltransferase
MWQKIRTTFTYAYDHFRDDYDFFYIAGDDTYAAVDNMRAYLDGPEVKQLEEGYMDVISNHLQHSNGKKWVDIHPRPLYFGSAAPHNTVVFPGGGPGYTLNQAVLEVFGTKGMDFLPNVTDSREDVFTRSVFFSDIGIILSNTMDDHGRRHYLVLDTDVSGTFYVDQPGSDTPKLIRLKYNITPAIGLNSVLEQGIAFHTQK